MSERPSGWWLLAAALVVLAVGFGVMFYIVESIHADKEAACTNEYGPEADWKGSIWDEGEQKLVCELPDGDLRTTDWGES